MTQPLLMIAGAATWADALAASLGGGAAVERTAGRGGYVARLADAQPALIVVDGDAAGWRFWATTPKTSPATRRIPLLVTAASSTGRAAALAAGADYALPPAELLALGPQLVAAYARLPDPARQAELDCACAGALPPLALAGVAKFNAGEYYLQHDLFEALWLDTGGPVRDLYRAILQVGVAYYQVERGNWRGAHKMLLRAAQWLLALPDACQGVDVARLRADAAQVRAELERLGPGGIAQFDRALLRPLRLLDGGPP